MKYLDWIAQDWGFKSTSEFLSSSFHIENIKPIFMVSAFFGLLSSYIEKYIGLQAVLYIAFAILLLYEFFTGVKASLKEGEKIESKKFGRFIFKIGSYTLILGIIHSFATYLTPPEVKGFEIAIFSWIYYTFFYMIVIQLLISVAENLIRLGYVELEPFVKALRDAFKKWFGVDILTKSQRKKAYLKQKEYNENTKKNNPIAEDDRKTKSEK